MVCGVGDFGFGIDGEGGEAGFVERAGFHAGEFLAGDGLADFIGDAFQAAVGDLFLHGNSAADAQGLHGEEDQADFLGGEFSHGAGFSDGVEGLQTEGCA